MSFRFYIFCVYSRSPFSICGSSIQFWTYETHLTMLFWLHPFEMIGELHQNYCFPIMVCTAIAFCFDITILRSLSEVSNLPAVFSRVELMCFSWKVFSSSDFEAFNYSFYRVQLLWDTICVWVELESMNKTIFTTILDLQYSTNQLIKWMTWIKFSIRLQVKSPFFCILTFDIRKIVAMSTHTLNGILLTIQSVELFDTL